MASRLSCAGLFAGLVLLGVAGILLATMPRQRWTPQRKLFPGDESLGVWTLQCGAVRCCEQMTTGAIYICPDARVPPSAKYTQQQCADLGAIVKCPVGSGVGTQGNSPTVKGINPAVPPSGEIASAYIGTFLSSWGTLVGQLLLMALFACCYKINVVEPILEEKGTLESWKRPRETDDFSVNICQCFDDIWVCLHGLFCPLARMGHTNAVSGVGGYWETIFAWCCCSMFIPLGPCCLSVYFRMRLKQIMNVRDNVCNDVIISCFCPCLSICQTGTAVDRALGYEVAGCCDLEWLDRH